ncbi:MAG: right-handed parallel beta-helix repeat-containing protein [Myxococcales bacterium]|nr:right-handed parallel beta-helix repeat-containing protein [Myxococcales bacterium]
MSRCIPYLLAVALIAMAGCGQSASDPLPSNHDRTTDPDGGGVGHGDDGQDQESGTMADAESGQDGSGDVADGGSDPHVSQGDGRPDPAETWNAPLGIPEPPFGIHERADNACGQMHEVPFSSLADLASLAPGSLVQLPAGDLPSEREVTIGGAGTPCQPIIVRGDPQGTALMADVTVTGSYVIVEDLEVDLSRSSQHNLGVADADHIALRRLEVHGLDIRRNTTVVFVSNSTDVLIWSSHIHDNGDFDSPGEIDVHGIGASMSHRLWVLDNHIHHNRGDGMQFGHRADNTLGDFYVGRNDIHDNGENSVDIKEASRVVISENTLHDEPNGTVVLHDCPIDAALIYNTLADAPYGVSLPSLEPNCDDDQPVSLFVLRNEFQGITGAAIQGWGTGKRYFVAGNRFTNVGTDVAVDPIPAGSEVSTDDAALGAGMDAFEATYRADIRR